MQEVKQTQTESINKLLSQGFHCVVYVYEDEQYLDSAFADLDDAKYWLEVQQNIGGFFLKSPPEKQGVNCDACNRTSLSPAESYRAYGANFCADCFDDCTG